CRGGGRRARRRARRRRRRARGARRRGRLLVVVPAARDEQDDDDGDQHRGDAAEPVEEHAPPAGGLVVLVPAAAPAAVAAVATAGVAPDAPAAPEAGLDTLGRDGRVVAPDPGRAPGRLRECRVSAFHAHQWPVPIRGSSRVRDPLTVEDGDPRGGHPGGCPPPGAGPQMPVFPDPACTGTWFTIRLASCGTRSFSRAARSDVIRPAPASASILASAALTIASTTCCGSTPFDWATWAIDCPSRRSVRSSCTSMWIVSAATFRTAWRSARRRPGRFARAAPAAGRVTAGVEPELPPSSAAQAAPAPPTTRRPATATVAISFFIGGFLSLGVTSRCNAGRMSGM